MRAVGPADRHGSAKNNARTRARNSGRNGGPRRQPRPTAPKGAVTPAEIGGLPPSRRASPPHQKSWQSASAARMASVEPSSDSTPSSTPPACSGTSLSRPASRAASTPSSSDST